MPFAAPYLDAYLQRARMQAAPTGALAAYADPRIIAAGGGNPALAGGAGQAVLEGGQGVDIPLGPEWNRTSAEVGMPENFFPPQIPTGGFSDEMADLSAVGGPAEGSLPGGGPPYPTGSIDELAGGNPAMAAAPSGALGGPAPSMGGAPPEESPIVTGTIEAAAAAEKVPTGPQMAAAGYESPESVERARAMAQEMMAGPDPKDKWLAVALAGAQMAASQNPSMLGAAGEGAVAGLGEYARQRSETRKDQLGGANLELTAEQVSQAGQAAYDKAIVDAQSLDIERQKAASGEKTANAAVTRAESTSLYYQALAGHGFWDAEGANSDGDAVLVNRNTGEERVLKDVTPLSIGKVTGPERIAAQLIEEAEANGQAMSRREAYEIALGIHAKQQIALQNLGMKAIAAHQAWSNAWHADHQMLPRAEKSPEVQALYDAAEVEFYNRLNAELERSMEEPAASASSTATGVTPEAIPPKAVEMLLNDPSPSAQAEFDAVFGTGAARAALGR